MEYLRFDTETAAADYDRNLLMEVAEFKKLPVVDGSVLGQRGSELTDEHPTTSWSPVLCVDGVGWLIYPPDWRGLNDFERSIIVEWAAPVVAELF